MNDDIRIMSEEVKFELVRSKRKTLSIAVYPDKSIIVRAPLEVSLREIKKRVQRRKGWINRQIQYFEQFEPRTLPRQYVNGEEHFYLGRRYRLKINDLNQSENGQAPHARASSQITRGKVILKNGCLVIQSFNQTPKDVSELLDRWYRQKANNHFGEIFEQRWQDFKNSRAVNGRYPLPKPNLKIRKMKTRWGSMSVKRSLTLNLELIKVPKECIEYVVAHELCHLLHHNHGAGFYRLLDTFLPDWTARKQRLELALA